MAARPETGTRSLTAAKRLPQSAGELARQHTALAIATLAELCRPGEQATVRVSAARALLDRGWGAPDVHVESRSVSLVAQLAPSPLAPREEWAAWQARQVAAGVPAWRQLPPEVVAGLPVVVAGADAPSYVGGSDVAHEKSTGADEEPE